MATFSLMQFVLRFCRRWSDRIGRRPVLLISTAESHLLHNFCLWFGPSGNAALGLLFARGVAEFVGEHRRGQAYIATSRRPERSKKMGLIGMAFGLGSFSAYRRRARQ